MEILWWLAPAAAVTVLAMLWAGWRGRVLSRRAHAQPLTSAERDAALQRMGAALEKPLPRAGTGASMRRRVSEPVEPASGVAVRRREN